MRWVGSDSTRVLSHRPLEIALSPQLEPLGAWLIAESADDRSVETSTTPIDLANLAVSAANWLESLEQTSSECLNFLICDLFATQQQGLNELNPTSRSSEFGSTNS